MTDKEQKYYDEEGEEYEDKNEYLRDRYWKFESLLCYFHTRGKTDAEIIKIFANVPTFSAESIKETIRQAKEVLNLKPFPYEWIYLDCGFKSVDQFSGEMEEKYYKWTRWVIETLEEEAKKQVKHWTIEMVKDKLTDNLKQHEGGNHKGHTYEKHVGKDLEWLLKRLDDEPYRDTLSSYPDEKTAQTVVNEIVTKRAKDIADWANKAEYGKTQAFEYNFNYDIGYGLKRGESALSSRQKAVVVLKKMQNSEVKTFTSYPVE